jgi:ATP-binding cassette subfamily F protein 3
MQFGFDYQKQYDFVVKLSGGERRRLYLLTILMKSPNFLILDEPTNDLDIETLGVLENFLVGYGGCLLVVSHDRYFISKTANKIWEIEDEKIIEFKGDYAEWVAWKERMAKQKGQSTEPVKIIDSKDSRKQGKQEAALVAEVKPQAIDKDLQKQIQKLQKVIAQIEQNIATLHTEKAAIEVEMANPAIYSDPAKMHIVEKSYQEKNALIKSMDKEYEIAFNDLLLLESK